VRVIPVAHGIAHVIEMLSLRSCLIDGEAVACDGDGLPSFDRLRYRRADDSVFLYAFDLLELDGQDLRREPLEVRKATLASVVAKAGAGLRLNEHLAHDDGEAVFRHACKLGLEGIVSKRLGSPYRSGRSRDWLKMKNPAAPAVKREAGGGLGPGQMATLILKRGSASRSSGQWRDDDYDVLEDGVVVGRIFCPCCRAAGAPLDVGERAQRARYAARRMAMAAVSAAWVGPSAS
jgi:bifunctional non-homologous end joining protein LigD